MLEIMTNHHCKVGVFEEHKYAAGRIPLNTSLSSASISVNFKYSHCKSTQLQDNDLRRPKTVASGSQNRLYPVGKWYISIYLPESRSGELTQTGSDKSLNLQEARRFVLEASTHGAKIVVLPECFNSPYSTASFPQYAEVLQPAPPPESSSPSFHALSSIAKDAGVYLVGGSIPELEPDTRKIFNTTLVFSPHGELLGKHRKAHLFDVDFPGKMTFRESDTLSPGNAITTVDLAEYGTIGLGICYDVRFAEFATVASRKGAFALIFPSAFNSTTGPLHWELLARARALDNQLYVAMCSQSYEPGSGYPAWGHSMVVDPNGQIMATTERGSAIVYADLDDASIGQARRQVPIGFQRRWDLYPDISKLV